MYFLLTITTLKGIWNASGVCNFLLDCQSKASLFYWHPWLGKRFKTHSLLTGVVDHRSQEFDNLYRHLQTYL